MMQFSNNGSNLIGQKMFAILDMAKKIEEDGNKVIHLELGQPRFQPPNLLVKTTKDSIDNKFFGYSSSYGLLDLRKEIKKKYNYLSKSLDIDNVIISPANLLITQSLHLICNPGDTVLVFTPSFPTYFAAVDFLGLKIKQVNLSYKNNYDLTKEEIIDGLKYKPKAIIINSGCNPTGQVFSKKILEFLFKTAEKESVFIISDETYGDLCYQDSYTSMLNFSLEKLIVISSFSKVFSVPGYRIGYAVSNNEIIDKLSLSNSTLISCLPIFTQYGISKVINNSQKYIEKNKKILLDILNDAVDLLNDSRVLNYRVKVPQSSFYLFIYIGNYNISGADFCKYLLENYFVATTPGNSFGDSYDSYLRLSLCGIKSDVINGVKIIIKALREKKWEKNK